MADYERRDTEHDEIDRLLPWYINETLDGTERAAVERHLGECAACRAELRRERELAATVRARGDLAPAPHPIGLERLLARIDAAEDGTPAVKPVAESRPRQSPAARFGGRRRRPLWLAAAAAAVAVVALGVVWQLPRGAGHEAPFHTLSQAAPPVAAHTYLRVVFADDLSERELRALLLPLNAEIVGGPSPLGVYTLALPAGGPGSEPIDWVIAHLRGNAGVRFAEVVSPGTSPGAGE